MVYRENTVSELKIAYIGGGSRGWAWTLMNDLAKTTDMSGTVALYDIDYEAARNNETIGNRICDHWSYQAVPTIREALTGADFVIISILPATFDEMEYDVHTPEEYGIYQSVGDTTGPGGFFRALRTVPMIREIAGAIREYCPKAWVINYTNPMAACVKTLYKEFPEIKAFGCCHEVFGTQELLGHALKDIHGVEGAKREEIRVNVVGVNHFTWFTSASYHNLDLFETYKAFTEKYYETGFDESGKGHWMNDSFQNAARVRFDLFRRFGYIAAAGDRHLAEFCDGEDYLKNPDVVKQWTFGLTPVSWRKNDLKNRLERSRKLLSGEETFQLHETGEEGTLLMRALLGLTTMVSNVNIPNAGQISNLPLGSIVETNAVFSANSLKPVMAGEVPESIYAWVVRASEENDAMVESAFAENKSLAYESFAKNHLVTKLSGEEKKALFDKMWDGTKAYLTMYH